MGIVKVIRDTITELPKTVTDMGTQRGEEAAPEPSSDQATRATRNKYPDADITHGADDQKRRALRLDQDVSSEEMRNSRSEASGRAITRREASPGKPVRSTGRSGSGGSGMNRMNAAPRAAQTPKNAGDTRKHDPKAGPAMGPSNRGARKSAGGRKPQGRVNGGTGVGRSAPQSGRTAPARSAVASRPGTAPKTGGRKSAGQRSGRAGARAKMNAGSTSRTARKAGAAATSGFKRGGKTVGTKRGAAAAGGSRGGSKQNSGGARKRSKAGTRHRA